MIQYNKQLFLQQHQRCVSQKTGVQIGYFLLATAHTTLPVFLLVPCLFGADPNFRYFPRPPEQKLLHVNKISMQ